MKINASQRIKSLYLCLHLLWAIFPFSKGCHNSFPAQVVTTVIHGWQDNIKRPWAWQGVLSGTFWKSRLLLKHCTIVSSQFGGMCAANAYSPGKLLSRKTFLKHWEAWCVRSNLRIYLEISLKGPKWWHGTRSRHQTVLLYLEHWTKTLPRMPEKYYWQKWVLSGFRADCYELGKKITFFKLF